MDRENRIFSGWELDTFWKNQEGIFLNFSRKLLIAHEVWGVDEGDTIETQTMSFKFTDKELMDACISAEMKK